MKITKLSVSSGQKFEKCQWAWYLSYICKIREPGTKATELGNICHSVWQILAHRKRKGRIGNDSRLNDPVFLTKICYAHAVRKNPQINFSEEDYDLALEWIWKVLNSRYDPRKLDVISAEKAFWLKLEDKRFAYKTEDGKIDYLLLNGYIDLIYRIDEETIGIIDWKTGKRKDYDKGKNKELEDFQKDLQLITYDLVCRQLYPHERYRFVTIYYVNDGGPFTVTFDDADLEKAYDRLYRLFTKIKKCNTPQRLIDDQTKRNQHFFCKKVCHFGMTLDNGERLCRKYWQIATENGFEAAVPIITSLTIDRRKNE